jgi:GH25 family lysozyme M1 (1,4-beta-N-acetylmuramidase)
MIRGIDVSAYQPNVDWQAVRAAGAAFAIIKVTDGNGYTNKYARAQVMGALAADLLVMLYHFAEPNGPNWKEDAAAEAVRLDEIADEFEAELHTKLFCFLDVERNTPLSAQEKQNWRTWTNEFRRHCREVGKRAIGFYSGKYFTMDLALEDDWSQTLLWCAKYPAKYEVDPTRYAKWPACWPSVAPWPRADIWQDGAGQSAATGGNDATWPGVGAPPHLSDVNVFAGTLEELEELIAAAV